MLSVTLTLFSVLVLAGAYYLIHRHLRERKWTEATLRGQDLVLRTIVSNAPIVLFAIDRNGIITFSEGQILQALGIKPGEHVGQSVFELYKHMPGLLANIRRALAGEIFSSFEQAAGLSFEVRYAPVRDHRGQVNGLIGVATDVTDRRQAEEALRLSEEHFRLLIEGVKDYAIFMLDSAGNVVSWNPGAERITGYRAEEITGRHFSVFYPPETVESDDPGQALKQAEAQGRFEDEGWRVRKDGSRFWASVIIAALRDQAGSLRGFAKVTRDITDRKLAEQAVRESEEQVRLLLDSTAQAVFGLDLNGNCTFCNPACVRLLGYDDPRLLLGQNMHTLLHRGHAEGAPHSPETCPIYESFRKGERVHEEDEAFSRADGTTFPAEYWSSPLWRQGKLVGAVVSFSDITERKKVSELERRTTDITLLSELGSRLQTCVNAEEAYNVIAHSARKLFSSESGAVCVLNSSRNLVEAVAEWGGSHCGEQVFEPNDCWALRSGRLHFVDGPDSPTRCRHISQCPPAAYLCVPMVAQGEALGVLHIQGGRHENEAARKCFGGSKQQLAATVAEQIGLALANLKLRETLRTQSIRDPLTGLYNRRYMEESLDRELRRAARSQRPLGAIMLDLDHFKQYNDAFGHDAGDTLLRELGNFLQKQVRGEDVACRYGGEEFMIILPGASLQATRQRAEQLRQGAKHVSVQHGGQSLGPITLSLGASVFPEHGSTATEILRAADDALYQAKKRGRDRVVAAEA